MTDSTFTRACPECGRDVECRLARSSDGLGVLPYAFEVRCGPEHEPTCKHHRSPEERWNAERPRGCRCPFGILRGDCPVHGELVPL